MITFTGDMTFDSEFKYLIKHQDLHFYPASIISEIIAMDVKEVLEKMELYETSFIDEAGHEIVADSIYKVDDVVIAFEMNRSKRDNLNEYKMRYLNHLYNRFFYKEKKDDEEDEEDKYEFSGTKVILLCINCFRSDDIDVVYDVYHMASEHKIFTKYMECIDVYLENSKWLWYNKVTLSKFEKYLTYLIMTRENSAVIEKFIEGDEILMAVDNVRKNASYGILYMSPGYKRELENEFEGWKRYAIREMKTEMEKEKAEMEKEIEKKKTEMKLQMEKEMEKEKVEMKNKIKKGIDTEKKEIATNMKSSGIDIDTIVKCVKLTKEEVLAL